MKINFVIKKFLFLEVVFLAALFAVQWAYAVEPRIIKVGAFKNFPLIFQDQSGNFKGLYVDILSEIGHKENITFEYVLGTWEEGLERIKSGRVDLLPSVAYTPERALLMDYCRNPLLTVWGEVYTYKSSKINGILEVGNKKIGMMKSDINAKNFLELTAKFGITINSMEFKNYEDVFKAIAEKQVDAGVVGVTFGAAKQMEYGLKSTGVVFNPINIYFTTAKGKNHDLILLLDKYLGDWKNEGHSFFTSAKQKWLHGSMGNQVTIPAWLQNALIILGIIIGIFLVFIVVLKLQVKRATQSIRQKNEELRESSQKWEAIVSASPDGIGLCSPDGKLLLVSDRLAIIYGYSVEEKERLIGRDIIDFVDPSYHKLLMDNIQRLFENKDNLEIAEYQAIKKDKSRFYVDVNSTLLYDSQGNPEGILFIERDITKRKESETALRESKVLTEAIVENVPLMIFLKDAVDLRFLLFNRAGEELLGYDRSALLGKNDRDIFPSEQADFFIAKDKDVIEGDSGILNIPEEPILTAKNGKRLLHTRKVCIRGADGVTKFLLGISEDITERRQAEDKIKDLLAEKEIILKEVHHRIKNNMNTISVLLNLQASKIKDPDSVAAFQDTENRVRSMGVLYDKLYQSSHYQEISVSNYLPSLVDEILANFPNRDFVTVVKKIDDFILNVKQIQPLGIIINELLTNIMKYAFGDKEQGIITIEAGLKSDTTGTGKSVCLVLQDNGRGMPESVSFENSTGFGLALVNMLAKQLRGSIQIKREKGTKIILEFAL